MGVLSVLQIVATQLQRQDVWVNDGKNGAIVLSSDVQRSNPRQAYKVDKWCVSLFTQSSYRFHRDSRIHEIHNDARSSKT